MSLFVNVFSYDGRVSLYEEVQCLASVICGGSVLLGVLYGGFCFLVVFLLFLLALLAMLLPGGTQAETEAQDVISRCHIWLSYNRSARNRLTDNSYMTYWPSGEQGWIDLEAIRLSQIGTPQGAGEI